MRKNGKIEKKRKKVGKMLQNQPPQKVPNSTRDDIMPVLTDFVTEIPENFTTIIFPVPVIKPDKMAEIRARFIKPIDRKYWIDKIWTTGKLESHADAEQINILYWFRVRVNI